MSEPFLTIWTGFLEEIQSAVGLLLSDVRACTRDLEAQDRELTERFGPAETWELEAERCDSLATLYEKHSQSLLVDGVERIRRSKVDERLSRAFSDFQHRADAAAHGLPVKADVAPKQLIEALDDSSGMSWWVELSQIRDRTSEALVRAAILDGLSDITHSLRTIEGGFYLLQAQSTLGLLDPWQLVHRLALRRVRGYAVEDDASRFDKGREKWLEQTGKRREELEELVGQFASRIPKLAGELTQALIRGPQPSTHRRQREQRKQYDSYWSRQRVTVRGLIDIEVSLVELGKRSVRATLEATENANQEYQSIIKELDSAIAGLEKWEVGQADPLPAASARLTPAAKRTLLWQRTIETYAGQYLPERIESLEPTRRLPGFREPWLTLEPRQIFLDAIEPACETAEEGCLGVERSHKALLREIDRGREVVTYSLQVLEAESENGEQIAIEGVANALALLTHQKETATDRTPDIEAALVDATASSLYQFLVAFELGRFSLVSHLAREGAARAGRRAAALAAERGLQFVRLGWSAVSRAYNWVLVSIGWIAPSGESRKPVETWGYFGDPIPKALAELPLIYDRLFRPEPVEDRRFLVGREDEIAAMEEARDFWKLGRMAAVLVDGERGSGKTSLLNCAVSGPFAGEPIVRVSIRERLLTSDAVRAFIAEALGVPNTEVLSSLIKERRVIIIEEAERTFIRAVDGMNGIKELMSLIADTAESNLWVLSLTSEGYRFLDAAIGVRRWFSHRLHASAVTSGELQDAILQRHNLSGLRLAFAEPPRKGRLQEWFRRQTARVQTPEENFFGDLHDLSGGVFRSAFSIWRRQISRVDGGVLHMSFPDSPDHSRLTQALSREDLFFLQMLLQHGSLTPEEDSRIFDCPLRSSLARIEHLIGRGVLEHEPVAPGFRIKPEAGILVRGALNARNLL